MIGFSEGFHDAAVAVVVDGQIKFATHSERYSRLKHDKDLDGVATFLACCANEDDITAFYERPFYKRTRQLFAGQFKHAFSRRHLALEPTAYHSHHLSHAAAAFQTGPYSEAACVVVDSIGEWDTVSVWKAEMVNGRARYKKKFSKRYPYSIGLWYSALTKWAGLRPLDEEYIFMGMGAYGSPIYKNRARTLLSMNNHKGIPIHLAGSKENIAKSAEHVLYEVLSDIFKIARKYSDNICYGGGVALNCVVNAKLQADHPNMWIMPNPGDAGGALGAALLSYGGKVPFSPYLGNMIYHKIDPKQVVDLLLRDGLCGVANGRAEFGPRALGNRSLLADPSTLEMKDRVNEIKRRQKFRPFAPVILEEHAQQWFDMPKKESRYMSYVYQCKKPDKIPACIHADGSARVQTVPKDSQSIIRQILECWFERTGCPVLLNTSLNVRGQPMVNTWDEALEFAQIYGVVVL